MSRPAHRGKGRAFAAFFIDYYQTGGVHSVISELVGLPLVLILLGGLWALGWDWRLLILLPLALACSGYIQGMRLFHQTSRVYKQLQDLYANHAHWRFTHIKTDDYLAALHRNAQTSAVAPGGAGGAEFARTMLAPHEYFFGEHLRLVVVETPEEEGVAVLATFATVERAWVFLNGDPRAMREWEHFTVLHEIGHTHPDSMLLGHTTRGDLTLILATLPVVALMLKWEPATFALLAAYLLVFLSMTMVTFKWLGRHGRYHEELNADEFALARCPRHWFEGLSEQDVRDFVATVSGNAPTGDGQGHTSPVFDAPLTDEQAAWRRTVLRNRLDRMLKGDGYRGGERVPALAAVLMKLLLLFQQLSLIALALALGLHHAALTTPRFAALLGVMLLITFAGMGVAHSMRMLATQWDSNLNAKPLSELTEEERKMLETHARGVRWREQFEAWRHRMRDKGLDNDAPAAGTNGRLFLPKEVDLYAEFETSESYIFHGKVIDYGISHVEYVPAGHSLVVVMKDRTRLDLGVKLGSRIRPHFLKAEQVFIIRTKDGESVEGVAVPLLKPA